jgi:hypothetical protein
MADWTSSIPLTFVLALSAATPAALQVRSGDELLKPGSLGDVLGTADQASASEKLQRWTQWSNGNNSTRKTCQGGSWKNC